MASVSITDNSVTDPPIAHAGGELYVSWRGDLGGGEFSIELDAGSGYRTQHSSSAASQKNLRMPAGNVRFRVSGAQTPNIAVDYGTY